MATGSTQPLTEMSTRNLPEGKGRLELRLTTLPPSVSRLPRENVGASTSHNPMGLHGLLQGQLYLYLYLTSSVNSGDMSHACACGNETSYHFRTNNRWTRRARVGRSSLLYRCQPANKFSNFLRSQIYFERLLGPITVAARYKTRNAFAH
jgi:hypothetical protein